MMHYAEIIETQGVKVPFVPEIITPKIERPMRNNRYEGGECAAVRKIVAPGDRVLELGAGVGLLSTVAAGCAGVASVTAVEANPDLIPLIRETHRLNGVGTVDLRNGVVSAQPGDTLSFYLRRDFWASSFEPDSRPYERVEELPNFAIGALMDEIRPTVVVCDIEGAELGLFAEADLSSVRAMVIELHPKVYGTEGLARVMGVLAAKGLHVAQGSKAGSSVQLFERREEPAAPASGSEMPRRAYRTWPIAEPRVMVATCMKDEGPFILEWLAWHRAVGVTDFVIFTNDCSDGSDRLLDRLDAMGEVRHLPNPALAAGSTFYQPLALSFAQMMREFREADFFLSIDVDEFVNVRAGAGRFSDLFEATGPFDVLSISEINHGANQQEHFKRGWIKDQFPAHQSDRPGKLRSRRGVKSIVRLSERVERIRNHRPDLAEAGFPALWLDGSGRYLESLQADRSENGIDVRGTYDLVALDHFALRSLDSYLMKMYRGDVVVADKKVSRAYWRTRNRNDVTSSTFERLDPAARECHRARFEGDAELMALHEACCAAHDARIAELVKQPEFKERRDWALREVW